MTRKYKHIQASAELHSSSTTYGIHIAGTYKILCVAFPLLIRAAAAVLISIIDVAFSPCLIRLPFSFSCHDSITVSNVYFIVCMYCTKIMAHHFGEFNVILRLLTNGNEIYFRFVATLPLYALEMYTVDLSFILFNNSANNGKPMVKLAFKRRF